MRRGRWLVPAALAAACVAATCGASGALAATHATHATVSKAQAARKQALAVVRHMSIGPAQRAGGTQGATDGSYNWSGYADTSATFTRVSGAWKEPSVTCNDKSDQIAVFWVGLDGWGDGTVEQDGTIAQCYLGTAYYYSWWEMYPTNEIQVVGSTVEPGDAISASVAFSAGKYHLKLTDATTAGNSFTTAQTCGSTTTCLNASAEWIAESPDGPRGYYPLPHFTVWHLSSGKATSGGVSAPISSYTSVQIGMIDATQSYYLALPGPLSASGAAFADTWMNSY